MASESVTQHHVPGRRYVKGRSLDLIVTFLSVLLVGGIAVDARSHAQGISFAEEGFFTPEHIFFYSAFLAIAAVLTGATVLNRLQTSDDWAVSVPAGYGVGVVGVLIFGFGGVGDFMWHSTFGFEQGTEALTSPSHLALLVGAVLFLSSPLRATWRRTESPDLLTMVAALVSGSMAFALIALFVGIVNPVMSPRILFGGELVRQVGVAGFMIFPALLVGAGVALHRRFDLPPGALTLVFLGPALMSAIPNLESYPLLLSIVFAGLVGDFLIQTVPPAADRPLSLRLFGVAVPLAFGVSYVAIAVYILGWTIAWSVHIWAGALVLGALGGLVATFIAVPDAKLGAGQ